MYRVSIILLALAIVAGVSTFYANDTSVSVNSIEYDLWEYNTPTDALADCDTVINKLYRDYGQENITINSIKEWDEGYIINVTQRHKSMSTDLEVYFYDFDEDPQIAIYLDSMFYHHRKEK